MKLKPMRNRIVVQREEPEGVSKGGIIIPDTAKNRPDRGKVLAVGEGRYLDNGEMAKFDVQPGDTVMYSRYCGAEVEVDGEEYLILTHDDVLAVLD